ncbi:UNVERIFIED_CONTAM: hypothetical protein Sangu_0372600 [Sesamum angustifolium]|uniref:Myb/SANT-like domain-containing protein n=1 Tax=Sesamum angustifolium TaxID=2727405 RepID=A0AAW2QRV2_9LAMI
MHNPNENVSSQSSRYDKVVWTTEMERVFIELMHEEFISHRLQSSTFPPWVWSRITEKMNSIMSQQGCLFTTVQLKGKLSRLRRAWRLLNDMITNGTGWGWDSERNTITYENGRLEEVYQQNPEYKKIVEHGLPRFELCTQMFSRNTVVGMLARSSSQPRRSVPSTHDIDEEQMEGTQSGSRRSRDEYEDIAFSQSPPIMSPPEYTSSPQPSPTCAGPSGSSVGRRGMSEIQAKKCDTMERLNESLQGKIDRSGPKATESIERCVDELTKFPDLPDIVFTAALERFHSHSTRMIFLRLNNENKLAGYTLWANDSTGRVLKIVHHLFEIFSIRAIICHGCVLGLTYYLSSYARLVFNAPCFLAIVLINITIVHCFGLPIDLLPIIWQAHVKREVLRRTPQVKARGRQEPPDSRKLQGAESIAEIMTTPHEGRFYDNIRMTKPCFYALVDALTSRGLLPHGQTSRISSIEEVALFMQTVRMHKRQRDNMERFQHSLETINRRFHRVLSALIASELWTARWYRHGSPSGPKSISIAKLAQNVLAICDFDMNFTYVYAGWEGSAADARVLDHAVSHDNTFPFPPIVGDAQLPSNHQVDIVIACCTLHNFIHKFSNDDLIFNEPDEDTPADMETFYHRGHPTTNELESQRILRDSIAMQMWASNHPN